MAGKLLQGLSRAAPGLLSLRPTLSAESLKPGMMLKLGDRAGEVLHAAVICWRGGTALAAPITGWPHTPSVHCGDVLSEVADDATLVDGVAVVSQTAIDAALASGTPALIDCFGTSLRTSSLGESGGAAASSVGGAGGARPLPLMATGPPQADLQPICASLHTGTAAIDVLTPIGRGQTMLILGAHGTGKTTIVLDAIVTQASTNLHCVLALSAPGADRAAAVARWLCERADAYAAQAGGGGASGSGATAQLPLASRLTVVAPRGESAAERALVAAAACALGERVRDSGGHALIVVDEWLGPTQLWDEAAEASGMAQASADAMATPSAAGGGEAGGAPEAADGGASAAEPSMAEVVERARRLERAAEAQRHHSAEQRVFYGSMLQRAAQLNDGRGGGSLTMLATVELLPAPSAQEGAPNLTRSTGTVGSSGTGVAPTERAFTVVDFAHRPRSQRSRLEALAARGIALTAATLERIGIPPPERASAPSGGAAAGESGGGSAAAAAALALALQRSNWSHLDQLKSLADGHVQLYTSLFAEGRRPALRPSESIGRVGVGSDVKVRPQPASAAMMGIAPSLRLELAQATDLSPAVDDAHSRLQRTRTAAISAALCTQLAGSPRRLSEEIALLLALIEGHLDHLANLPPSDAAGQVDELLTHVRAEVPLALRSIEESGRLDPSALEALRTSFEQKMPRAAGRALFVSWDTAGDATAMVPPGGGGG